MKLKPLFDKVIVEEIKEEVSRTGILLPKSAEEKPIKAKVVEIGNGGKVDGEQVEMIVKKGDIVLYSKFAGTEFKLDNKTYVILKQEDILAIIED